VPNAVWAVTAGSEYAAVAERTSPAETLSRRQPKVRRIDAVGLLTIYIFLLVAIPSSEVFAPLGGSGGPATVFAALLLGLYVVLWLHPGFKLDHGRQPIRVAGALFFCVAVAAYVSANRQALPTLELNAADRGIISMAGWLAVLLVTADGVDSADRLRELIRRIVLGASAMAALGITQFFTGLDATKYILIPGLTSHYQVSDLLTRGGHNRPSATAAHPLEFAAVLAMCLPLAIHQARFAPAGRGVWRWLQVGLLGLALPMSVSRSAFLALAAAFIVMLPTWPRADRWRAYALMLASSVVIWAMIPGLLGTIRNLFFAVGNDGSTASRTSAWGRAAPFISAHPWFGRGFGTFLPQTYFFVDDQYLGTIVEMGAVGLLALVLLILTGWCTARAARRISIDPETRDLGQSLAASVAVAAVAFSTFDALGFAIGPGIFFLILGCIGAYARLARRERRVEAPAG
jgi:O-antigen ligase